MSGIPERCAPFDADLSAWIDDELDRERAATVGEHVGACARCGAQARALREVDETLCATAIPPAPESLRARLRGRIALEGAAPRPEPGRTPSGLAPRRPRRLPLGIGLAAAAGLVAALALPRLLHRGEPEPTALARSEDPTVEPPPAGELAPAFLAEDDPRLLADRPILDGSHLGARAEPEEEVPGSPDAAPGAAIGLEEVADLELIEHLELAEALPETRALPPVERVPELPAGELRERLARVEALPAAERARLERNLERWRAMSDHEHALLRARWSALPPEERARLRDSAAAAPLPAPPSSPR
jgi:Putative zinc-finger